MLKRLYLYITLSAIITTCSLCANDVFAQNVPRVVIALYDSSDESNYEETTLHTFAEMPLNHLGLTLEYHDVHEELPDLSKRNDVIGIISWFPYSVDLVYKNVYVDWLVEANRLGKKIAIMGESAILPSKTDKSYNIEYANKVFTKMGLRMSFDDIDGIYGVTFSKIDKDILWYEQEIGLSKPSFKQVVVADHKKNTNFKAHLMAKVDGLKSDFILASSNNAGCYVADGYAALMTDENKKLVRGWYIKPFSFFKKCFGLQKYPTPDTTTIAGRRIYYSHIDGDGWNSISHISKYNKSKDLSAKVILEEAIKPYPDLPISVSIVAADISDEWSGSQQSRDVAREILLMPQIEAATHTYSHPFHWNFFSGINHDNEEQYLDRYTTQTWNDSILMSEANIFAYFRSIGDQTKGYKVTLKDNYTVPRAYARQKFSLDKEITGSINEITDLLPKDKTVKIIMWSGDTKPFEAAVELSRDIKIRNINGGDSRFDIEYPSIAWLSPVGRKIGKQQQIYASASNENTYTKLWHGRFYGFKFLKQTTDNTEKPIRLKPFNIYYHMYTGEKKASLAALISNLEYARESDISPITASNFAAIGDGFFSTKLNQLSRNSWQITKRDELQTIRFDNAKNIFVDFKNSTGVIGYRKTNGSIYIYLDKNNYAPILTIKNNARTNFPYLIDSRWQVWNVVHSKGKISFKTYGYGNADMNWKVPKNTKYTIDFAGVTQEIKVSDNILKFGLKNKEPKIMDVSISY